MRKGKAATPEIGAGRKGKGLALVSLYFLLWSLDLILKGHESH